MSFMASRYVRLTPTAYSPVYASLEGPRLRLKRYRTVSFWSGIMSNDQNRRARLLAGDSFLLCVVCSERS